MRPLRLALAMFERGIPNLPNLSAGVVSARTSELQLPRLAPVPLVLTAASLVSALPLVLTFVPALALSSFSEARPVGQLAPSAGPEQIGESERSITAVAILEPRSKVSPTLVPACADPHR